MLCCDQFQAIPNSHSEVFLYIYVAVELNYAGETNQTPTLEKRAIRRENRYVKGPEQPKQVVLKLATEKIKQLFNPLMFCCAVNAHLFFFCKKGLVLKK